MERRQVGIAGLVLTVLLGMLATAACGGVASRPPGAPTASLPRSPATPGSPLPVPTVSPSPATSSPPAATPGPLAERPAWTKSDVIAYVRGSSDVRSIHVLELAEGRDTRFGAGGHPSWSGSTDCPPGGTCGTYVIALERPGSTFPGDVFVVAWPSGTVRTIVPGAVRPAWSNALGLLSFSRSVIDMGDTWLVDGWSGTGERLVCGGAFGAWMRVDEAEAQQWLACVGGAGIPELEVVRSDGSGRVPIGPGANPAWDLWGGRLIYEIWQQDAHDLGSVDPITGASAVLVRRDGPVDTVDSLLVVDDGSLIVGLDGRLERMDLEAGTSRNLTGALRVVGRPSLRSDRDWLVVAGSAPGEAGTDLYAVRTDGGGWFRLTRTRDAAEPAWRPTQG